MAHRNAKLVGRGPTLPADASVKVVKSASESERSWVVYLTEKSLPRRAGLAAQDDRVVDALEFLSVVNVGPSIFPSESS